MSGRRRNHGQPGDVGGAVELLLILRISVDDKVDLAVGLF
jgi:hypothetical protein